MIVGIVGKERAGKDEVAKVFKKNGYFRLAFADSLKKYCKSMFNITDEEMDDDNKDTPLKKLSLRSPREVLKEIGTATRSIYPNIWIDKTLSTLDTDYSYIITDVRFKNELEAVQALGAKIIRLERPDHLRVVVPESKDPNHFKRVEQDIVSMIKPDFVIVNDGTIEQLHAKVEEIIRVIGR